MSRKYTLDEAVAAFWSKVNKDGPTQPHMETPCWLWTGALDGWGYGQLCSFGLGRGAHRVAYILAIGQIPPNALVLHACDEPRCVNASHLRAGSNTENSRDRENRGRSQRGEKHNRAKLTWAKVLEMRQRWAAGESIRALSRAFGVSHPTAWHAIKGKAWARQQ